MGKYHTPVLKREVLDGLVVQVGKKYIDATTGDGALTLAITESGGIVLGMDADSEAIERAKNRLEGKNATLVHANFADIERVARSFGFNEVSGIVFDLGVSSYQLDTRDRGFSYRFPDAPLDLRFDQRIGIPADDFVNRLSIDELYEIFTRFGEEERARSIAHAIVRARKLNPIKTTGDLSVIIRNALGGPASPDARLAESKRASLGGRTGDRMTLSRIFQALRMAVNDELAVLTKGLSGAERLIEPGGRLAVISFHSLEDRYVKQRMRTSEWVQLTKKPIRPSQSEILTNPRSRSAKLRIAQKV